MSTIKNGLILLYCHFNKIIKGPVNSFQSPALSQNYVRNVCDTTQWYLIFKHKCNFHYVAMPINR